MLGALVDRPAPAMLFKALLRVLGTLAWKLRMAPVAVEGGPELLELPLLNVSGCRAPLILLVGSRGIVPSVLFELLLDVGSRGIAPPVLLELLLDVGSRGIAPPLCNELLLDVGSRGIAPPVCSFK